MLRDWIAFSGLAAFLSMPAAGFLPAVASPNANLAGIVYSESTNQRIRHASVWLCDSGGNRLQDSVTSNRSALPYLVDLPILGPAFRDDQFQRGETEIVILVTPYVVNPVNDPTALRLPTNGPISSDLDRLLYMRTAAGSGQRVLAPTPGVAGFIVP